MNFKHFLLIITLISCKQTETKKVVYTFPNGQIGEVRFYPKPSDTLTYRKEVFYNSGAKGYVGHVAAGKKTGTWTWWYPNGMKKDECTYRDGFYTDTVFHWYDNGQLKQIEIVSGQHVKENECCNCNGTVISYYENGQVKEKVTRVHDLREDTVKSWYDNGQLEYWAFFRQGKEEGTSEWFHRNGIRMTKGLYVNGKLEGNVYHWDSLGKITFITTYKNGQIIKER